jgi:hypothetical protein
VNDSGLGCIVGRLQLGNVHNVSAHAGRGNEAAALEVDLVAVEVRAFLRLAPEVLAGGPRAVEGAVKVGAHHLPVVLQLPVDSRALRPRDARIGNEDIEAAVEFLDDLVDRLVDVVGVENVDLISAA